MPSVLKRRSLFETEIDPDAIQINLFGDEKPCGTLVLSPEDLRMLVRFLFLKVNKNYQSFF